MAYVVLARKYRPGSFAEVVGQEEVKRTLQGALEADRVGHAYLFAGPRGTGKTTTARIFAKALNCEQGPGPEPCNACARCKAADSGAEADLVEIDGASNNGVEHVRSLRDQAAYAPMEARTKIYLVDEVHMLSKSAFNALLKTLEEPPPHVKFLFATTEPHRVLDTILSRCQVLKLTPLSEERITARLDEVFAAEGVEAEDGVTRELARRARGGMRDALSLADQVLARASRPTLADLSALDNGGSRLAAQVLGAAARADKAAVLGLLPADEGREGEVLADLLDHLRAAVVAGLCGPNAPQLASHAATPEEREALAELARRIGQARAELWLTDLLQARERMRLLPAHGRVILEAALLEMARDEQGVGVADLIQRLESLEQRWGGAPAPRAPQPAAPSAPAGAPAREVPAPPPAGGGAVPAPARPPEAAPGAARPQASSAGAPGAAVAQAAVAERPVREAQGKEEVAGQVSAPASAPPRVRTNSAQDAWEGFLSTVAERSESTRDLLAKRGRLLGLDEGTATVQLRGLSDAERGQLFDTRNRRRLEQALATALGRPLRLELQDASQAQAGAEDAFTQKVASRFGARIEE
ncbi:MAG: DNA polymerase III subunit gamma/tau [Planctomycetes bacterium]|nr:DNA polymerase III subunit gamma/tau [Planctomycetota bacterium]